MLSNTQILTASCFLRNYLHALRPSIYTTRWAILEVMERNAKTSWEAKEKKTNTLTTGYKWDRKIQIETCDYAMFLCPVSLVGTLAFLLMQLLLDQSWGLSKGPRMGGANDTHWLLEGFRARISGHRCSLPSNLLSKCRFCTCWAGYVGHSMIVTTEWQD